jgi:hypothetical protein
MAFAADYIDVAARVVEFRAKHPDGSLQPFEPWRVVEVAGATFIVYTAAAYRTPDDIRPGVGTAWEPFPGLTNFTRNSELQNAETSAWGRAIIAVGAADAKKGVASAEDVRNRQAEQQVEDGAPSGKVCVNCGRPILLPSPVKVLGSKRYAHETCPQAEPTP